MTTHKKKDTGEQVADWVVKNWKVIFTPVILLALGGTGYLGVNTINAQKEESAQEELFAIQKQVEDKKDELAKAALPAEDTEKAKAAGKEKAAAVKNESKEAPKTAESLKANFSDAISKYEAFVKAQAGKKASHMAALQLAALASEYHDNDLALKTLESVGDIKSSDVFYVMVHGQIATLLMEKGEYKEAITHLDKVLAEPKQKFAHAEALLRKGTCHAELKEWDEAEKAFAQIETDHPTTSAAYTAKGLKRLVLLKKGQKS